jgi:hypothetical protein
VNPLKAIIAAKIRSPLADVTRGASASVSYHNCPSTEDVHAPGSWGRINAAGFEFGNPFVVASADPDPLYEEYETFVPDSSD